MAGDYFCEAPHCKQTAIFFVLMGQRVCEVHAALFREMHVTLCSIDLSDDKLYDWRKELVGRGLSNLDMLETECDSKREQMWEEIEDRAAQRYEEIKQDISEVRRSLIEVMQNRQSQMSYEDCVVCEAPPTSLLFHLVKGGCRLPVAVALLVDFHSVGCDRNLACFNWVIILKERAYNLAKIGGSDVSKKTAICAKYLTNRSGFTFQQCESLVRKLQILFAELAKAVVEECFQDMNGGNEAGDFRKSLMALQKASDTLRTMEYSSLYLKLSVSTAETLTQAARWKEVIPLCLETLSTWVNTPHHSFLLHILYYLANAHYELGSNEQGFAAVKEWTEQLHADSPSSQCILLCIQADKLHVEERYKEAEHLYEEALELDATPTFISICSRYQLGDVYLSLEKELEARRTLVDTCNLFLENFPQAYAYAACGHSLADLFFDPIQNFERAEEAYERSIQLYETNFSHTLAYADCMRELASLFDSLFRHEEAIPLFRKAIAVYSTHFPTSQEYAECLYDLGNCLEWIGLEEEAEEQLLKAIGVLSAYYPHSEVYANCLSELGYHYSEMDQLEEAEKYYKEAITLFSTEFSMDEGYTPSLAGLANVYKETDRWSLAESYHIKAQKLSIDFADEYDSMDCHQLRDLYN